MVKLHTSLLAITLATGSALAASRSHSHKNYASPSRQQVRPDPSLGLLQPPPDAHYTQHINSADMLRNLIKIREFVDDPEEGLFERDLDVSDDLEARDPAGGRVRAAAGLVKAGRAVFRSIKKYGSSAFNAASTGSMVYSAFRPSSQPSRRDLELEDGEDLFERDFDIEELFGREYVPLDERDIIDDEDLFVRDLEAEEFYGREYGFLDEQYH